MYCSILTYNQVLHEIFDDYWPQFSHEQDPVNPLGTDRENADFHALPLHVKVRLLNVLIEIRLMQDDSEIITKVRIKCYV